MPEMAQVVDGELVRVGLPQVGELLDGRTVSNYHLLPEETLREEGWHEVRDDGEPELTEDVANTIRRVEVGDDGIPEATYELIYHPPWVEVNDTVITAHARELETITFEAAGQSFPVAVDDGIAELELLPSKELGPRKVLVRVVELEHELEMMV